jgi:hypothetical protein
MSVIPNVTSHPRKCGQGGAISVGLNFLPSSLKGAPIAMQTAKAVRRMDRKLSASDIALRKSDLYR